MALYICRKCRATFNTPTINVWCGDPWVCCPECGDPDFERACSCVCCNRDALFDDLTEGLCEECLEGEAEAQDYADFAHDKCAREAFASFLRERKQAQWAERRMRALREVVLP